jgi:hypothetical protein
MALLLAAFGHALSHAQSTCSQANVQEAAQRVRSAQTQLLAYKLDGDMDLEVPPPLQAKIRDMKDALAAGVGAVMQCAPPEATKSSLENSLAAFLISAKPPRRTVAPNENDFVYGKELRAEVSMPEPARNLALIELHFDIECGWDSLLLGYEQLGGRWQRVLRWQSSDYKEISGAFGDFFQYVVVPQPAPQSWTLAVAHGMPWCSSNMSEFKVDLIAPSAGEAPQRTLAHLEHGYRRDYDSALGATPDGFQIRAHTDSLDGGIVIRPGIFRYRVDGDKLERVQPIAMNGRDFVDEWLQVPWSDAQRWSAKESIEALRQAHGTIGSWNDPNSKELPLLTYGPVRGCSDSPLHFQVELAEDWSQNKPPRPNSNLYFQIEEGRNSFTMLSASSSPDSRCTGRDIMPKQ